MSTDTFVLDKQTLEERLSAIITNEQKAKLQSFAESHFNDETTKALSKALVLRCIEREAVDPQHLDRLSDELLLYVTSSFQLGQLDAYIAVRRYLWRELNDMKSDLSVMIGFLSSVHCEVSEFISQRADSQPMEILLILQRLLYLDIQLLGEYHLINQQKLSWIDPLTNLMNEQAFDTEFDRIVSMSNRFKTHVSLLYVNLVDFREFNNSQGESVGDELLVALGSVMQSSCRMSDYIARLHDDHFAVILPNTELADLHTLCGRFITGLERTVEWPVSLAIGGAEYLPGTHDTLEKVFYKAQENMRVARQRSRLRDASEIELGVESKKNNVFYLVK